MKVKLVDETDYGLFLWEMPDGSLVCDEDRNYLNIPGHKNDRNKIKLLEDAARDLGLQGGRAIFMAGNRRVTDEEYEYQKQRMEWGLIPDELDYGAAREELMQINKGFKK